MLIMKHIIALTLVTAFTVVAAKAGDSCCKDKAACDSKAKVVKKAGPPPKGAQLLVMK